uniref:Uncharacterized protein n=1 Tax=Leptobrachium leishanense TaxID=445787 RepID=A0A8C5QZX8_9ANUR
MVRTSHRKPTRKSPNTPGRPSVSPISAYFDAPTPRPSTRSPTKMAASPSRPEASSTEGQSTIRRLEALIVELPTRAELPTRSDFKEMLDNMQATFGREIADVRADISAIDTWVTQLEARAGDQAPGAHDADPLMECRYSDMHRRLDDLENRTRRHNIRVGGVHEGVTETKDFLLGAFVHILGCPPLPFTAIDRAHRALRPKAATEAAPPRDIICHLPDFALKDAIMQKARTRRKWRFAEETIELYQDLSPHTLSARRALRPVTQLLQEAELPYRWGFPLSL